MRPRREEISMKALKLYLPEQKRHIWVTPLEILSLKTLEMFKLTKDGEKEIIARAKWLNKFLDKQNIKDSK